MNTEIEQSAILLTLDQAAKRLSVSRRTLEREIARGVLHAVKIGKAIRIRASELSRYVDSLSGPVPQPA